MHLSLVSNDKGKLNNIESKHNEYMIKYRIGINIPLLSIILW